MLSFQSLSGHSAVKIYSNERIKSSALITRLQFLMLSHECFLCSGNCIRTSVWRGSQQTKTDGRRKGQSKTGEIKQKDRKKAKTSRYEMWLILMNVGLVVILFNLVVFEISWRRLVLNKLIRIQFFVKRIPRCVRPSPERRACSRPQLCDLMVII